MFKGLILAGMCAINGMMSGPVSSQSGADGSGEHLGTEIALCCTGDSIRVDCTARTAKNADIQSVEENSGQEVDHN